MGGVRVRNGVGVGAGVRVRVRVRFRVRVRVGVRVGVRARVRARVHSVGTHRSECGPSTAGPKVSQSSWRSSPST